MKQTSRFLILSVAGKRDHQGLSMVRPLIEQLLESFEKRFADNKNTFNLCLQTGFADGADIIAADTARQWKHGERVNVRLEGIIPFTKELYLQTITQNELFENLYKACQHVRILDGRYLPGENSFSKECRARAYRQQAECLLEGCDVFFAIADEKENSKAGGTLETTELALKKNIPVIFLSLNTLIFFWLESASDFEELTAPNSSLIPKEPDVLSLSIFNLFYT